MNAEKNRHFLMYAVGFFFLGVAVALIYNREAIVDAIVPNVPSTALPSLPDVPNAPSAMSSALPDYRHDGARIFATFTCDQGKTVITDYLHTPPGRDYKIIEDKTPDATIIHQRENGRESFFIQLRGQEMQKIPEPVYFQQIDKRSPKFGLYLRLRVDQSDCAGNHPETQPTPSDNSIHTI